jgi:hypothetical protein
LSFLLQPLDPDVEPRQRDVVVKIEGISDLFVDVLPRSGDLFITRFAGVRDPLPQVLNFRRIVRPLGGGQEQPASIEFCGARKKSAGCSGRERRRVSGKRHHVVERQVDDIGRH